MSFALNSLVMKVFLPIIVGVAILGTLQSMKSTSLDPQVNSVEDALGQLDRSFVLGDSKNDKLRMSREQKARHEFRQVVIFNMFTAQHCAFLPKIDEMPQNSDFSSLGKGEVFYPQKLHKEDTDQKVGVFEVLKKENELPLSCVGAGNVLQQIPPSPSDFMPEVLSSDSETGGSGNDMEGRYGRVNFQVEETFRLQDPRVGGTDFDNVGESAPSYRPDLWRGDRMISMVPAGMNFNSEFCDTEYLKTEVTSNRLSYKFYDEEIGSWTENLVQGLYADIKGFVFGDDVEYDGVLNSYGGGPEGLYAYRVRMAGMPMFKPGAMIENYGTASFCGIREIGEGTMKSFIFGNVPYRDRNKVEYVMCKGAEGYIQSNAAGLEDGEEAAADALHDNIFNEDSEAIVFPIVQIVQGKDCLDNSDAKFYAFNGEQSEKIISPRIDLDSDGKREYCSLEDVRNDITRTWKVSQNGEEIKVGCALTKKRIFQPPKVSERRRGHSYYTTVWYAKQDKCEVEYAGITEMFHVTGDLALDGYYTGKRGYLPNDLYTSRQGLILRSGKGWATATYDLSFNSGIDKIYLKSYVTNGRTRILFHPEDKKNYEVMKLSYGTTVGSDTRWKVFFGEEKVIDRVKTMELFSETYIDMEDGKSVKWVTDDETFKVEDSRIPPSIEKIEIRANKQTGTAANGVSKIGRLKVSGDLC